MAQTAEVQITLADPSHEQAIRALSDATHAAHRARLPHVFDPDNRYQHDLLDAAFAPPVQADTGYRSMIRVATRGADMLGYVFVIWDASEQSEATALIADIAIAEDLRGTGIGKLLLDDLREQMTEKGWTSLRADVWSGNTASHALFKGAEFASERVTYRFGTPPPLESTAPQPASKGSDHFWWIVIAFLLVIAVVASFP